MLELEVLARFCGFKIRFKIKGLKENFFHAIDTSSKTTVAKQR